MQLNAIKNHDKKIKLKRGTNYGSVAIVIGSIITAIVLCTSNSWLPDSRKVVSLEENEIVSFERRTIKGVNFFKDVDKGMGEISFTVEQEIEAKDNLILTMGFDGTGIYPEDSYRIITGSLLPTTDEKKFQQEYLIQFSLPEDFYFISLYIEQETVKKAEIPMDYRNFKEKVLTEKGENYLVSFDEINLEIIKQETKVNDLSKQQIGFKSSIDSLTDEIRILETKIKSISDEQAKIENQKNIDLKKESLADYTTKNEECTTLLSNEQKVLEDLIAKKELQR